MTVTKLDTAAQPADLEASEAGEELEELDGSGGAEVISFGDVETGPADMVVAPPKREQLAGFELYGTGPTSSDDAPQLTLPPGTE